MKMVRQKKLGEKIKRIRKKVLTNTCGGGIITKLSREGSAQDLEN